jgi:hypothetical protein
MIVAVFTWIGIVIALIILVLFTAPIKMRARGSADERGGLDYLLIIDWAFGLFSLRAVSGAPPGLYFAGLRLWRISFKKGKKEKPREKSKKEKPSPLTWLGWVRENFSTIRHILVSFGNACFLRGYLIGKIGLADPADTAILGLLFRLIQVQTKRVNVSMTTVYHDEILHMRAKIQSTLIIGYLALVALRLLLDKEIRVMLRGLPRTREKEVLL